MSEGEDKAMNDPIAELLAAYGDADAHEPSSAETWRAFFCDSEDGECVTTCARCRTRASRSRAFHRSISDEEFNACRDHFVKRGKGPQRAAMRRYIHETLRRRNVPYEDPDPRLCVRLSRDELDEVKAAARREGMSLQAYGRVRLGFDP